MAQYALIESRDPYEYGDPGQFADLAVDLASSGNAVTFFLIQNGVLVARKGAKTGTVDKLTASGKVTVAADDFSLRERGIRPDNLSTGIRTSNVESLVDLLMTDGCKAIWH